MYRIKFSIFNFQFPVQTGQTLLELLVVMTIVSIVVGGLVFAIIGSIRNSSFAKNQAEATKFAQEGIERVRSGRDRNDPIGGNFVIMGSTITSWQDSNLWSNRIDKNCGDTGANPPINCYFKLTYNNTSIGVGSSYPGAITYLTASTTIPSTAETISSSTQFTRAVILTDSNDICSSNVRCYTVEKDVRVVVSWTDFTGTHESRLSTILRKI